MNLVILSPEREIFSGTIKSVTVPGTEGQFQMLDRHAPIVAALGKGLVKVVTAQGEKMQFDVSGGFVEVLNNEAALLVSGITE